MLWGHDPKGDNLHFLERVDADLYYRTTHNILGGDYGKDAEAAEAAGGEDGEKQARKDVSSLSRLLWHHGMEALVMMLGAYMQAPSASHAYFLKCRTEDAEKIAGLLLSEERPKYHRLIGDKFSLRLLLEGIHNRVHWDDRDKAIDRWERALRDMLHEYADEQHRWEYNSIKHGLRASHGTFALAGGLEEVPGVEPPPEAMQMVGYSRDASFFDVARPLRNATKQASKMHFLTEKVSVSWSLEKVLCELQLISVLLANVVATLRVVAGRDPKTVKFTKITDDEPFWENYFDQHAGNVPSSTMCFEIDARQIDLPTDKAVFDSYKQARPAEAR
jgi:hypothetical protein